MISMLLKDLVFVQNVLQEDFKSALFRFGVGQETIIELSNRCLTWLDSQTLP